MKTRLVIIILGIIISSSIIFGLTFKMPLNDSAQPSFESPFREEHYFIEITGMKDIYRIGEQYDFSHVISGYGYSCGSKKITFPDQSGEIMTIYSGSSCIAEEPMRQFVIDSKKEYDTTSVHGVIEIPGIYNVTVTFDRPSRDFPTIATKEFRVPPLNSWYNNQMRDTDLQTVMDSCANDSPKERMKNALRYTNETHVFLNLGCEWKKIGKYTSDTDGINAERDTKLAAGYKLYPGVGWIHPDDLVNQQSIYMDNPNNLGELILDIDSMIQVQKILDKCDYVQKLESGEIPAQNPDGSYNVVHGDLPFYNNGTHYIDSNTCKWIDSFESVTYNCFEANPMEQNWYDGPDHFDNGTHRIDVQNCKWLKIED